MPKWMRSRVQFPVRTAPCLFLVLFPYWSFSIFPFFLQIWDSLSVAFAPAFYLAGVFLLARDRRLFAPRLQLFLHPLDL